MVIYLVLLLPTGSSDLPESRRATLCSLLVLLRMGFTCALPVTSQAVVSYTAFPPLPHCCGGLFLLHFPGSHLHRTLSGILPCEARTFLRISPATIYPAQLLEYTMKRREFQLPCPSFPMKIFPGIRHFFVTNLRYIHFFPLYLFFMVIFHEKQGMIEISFNDEEVRRILCPVQTQPNQPLQLP